MSFGSNNGLTENKHPLTESKIPLTENKSSLTENNSPVASPTSNSQSQLHPKISPFTMKIKYDNPNTIIK
jgi:hypothetical protein